MAAKKKDTSPSSYGVYIAGATGPDAEAVSATAESILSILAAGADEKTKRLALKIMGRSITVTSPSNLSFNNVSVDFTPTQKTPITEETGNDQ
jgi:hypothetical protein